MTSTAVDVGASNAGVDAYVQGLIDEASAQRLPGLFADDTVNAIYRLRDRNGITVIAVRTTELTEEQLLQIMSFRLGQYLAVGYLDTHMIHDLRLKHEPLSGVSPGDIHVIAGSAQTGEMLGYGAIRVLPDVPAGVHMRDSGRSLFRNEKVFGRGIFERLSVLPDLAVTQVRELGPFVKNQQKGRLDELALRAPIETFVAGTRMFLGPLRSEIQAVIGGLEENVVKRNMAYFHWPEVVLRPDSSPPKVDPFLLPYFQHHTICPFAMSTADLPGSVPRLAAIEQALELPGWSGSPCVACAEDGFSNTREQISSPERAAAVFGQDVSSELSARRTRLWASHGAPATLR